MTPQLQPFTPFPQPFQSPQLQEQVFSPATPPQLQPQPFVPILPQLQPFQLPQLL